MNIYKKFSNPFLLLVTVIAFIGLAPIGSVEIEDLTSIPEAKAEAACPPPQTYSNIVIREGSASGPLLLSASTEDEPNNFQTHTLEVDYGTVLYVNAYTEGVELVNRGMGSVQHSTLPGTVTTPSASSTPNAGGYKPTGYDYTKQQTVVFTSDSLTTSGSINVSGSNSCIDVGGGGADELGSSGLTVYILVGANPDFIFNCDSTKTVTRGEIATYGLSATPLNGYSGSISVTMASSPTGPVMSPSTVGLNTGNSYLSSGSVDTTSLTADTYNLTFTADDGTAQKTCLASLIVENVRVSVNLQFDASDGPTQPTPTDGDSGTLSWVTINADSCTGSMEQGDDPDGKNPWATTQPQANTATEYFNVSGMQQNTTYEFGIICQDQFGNLSAPDTVVVNVGESQAPTADIRCLGEHETGPEDSCRIAYGHVAELSWISDYTTSCEIDQGIGPVATTGSQYTPALTSTTTYTLLCQGLDGKNTAEDSVIVNVDPPDDYFTLTCSPVSSSIKQTQNASYVITAKSFNGFNSSVTLNMTVQSGPGSVSATFTQNPVTPTAGGAVSTATITTSGGTPTGTYILLFSGTGGGKNASASCDLNVSNAPTPEPPEAVAARNSFLCEQVDISWEPASSGTEPSEYVVYRRQNNNDSWQQIGNVSFEAGRKNYDYADTSPIVGGTNYYGVAAVLGNSSSGISDDPSPVSPNDCAPSLVGSDKDLMSVDRGATSIANLSGSGNCNGSSDIVVLPNNDLFRAGDALVFNICAKNSGSEDLTGLSIEEDVINSSYLSNAQITNNTCTSSLAVNAVCSATVEATIDNPGGPSGLYRFQNVANISASGVNTGKPVNITVKTPPYLFSVGSGTPVRNETSP